MISDLNMSHEKMSDCVSFPLFVFTSDIKILILKVIEILFEILIFNEKDMTSDLNMCYRDISDFVSFSLCGFTLVIKLKNFDLESH